MANCTPDCHSMKDSCPDGHYHPQTRCNKYHNAKSRNLQKPVAAGNRQFILIFIPKYLVSSVTAVIKYILLHYHEGQIMDHAKSTEQSLAVLLHFKCSAGDGS